MSSSSSEYKYEFELKLWQKYPKEQLKIVFDFDCTLTAVHVYFFVTKKRSGNPEINDDDVIFFFGGEDRLENLTIFLTHLRKLGALLEICTHNESRLVLNCLKKARLDHLFRRIVGRRSAYENVEMSGNWKKMNTNLFRFSKAKIMNTYAMKYNVIFIDDTSKNYVGVEDEVITINFNPDRIGDVNACTVGFSYIRNKPDPQSGGIGDYEMNQITNIAEYWLENIKK